MHTNDTSNSGVFISMSRDFPVAIAGAVSSAISTLSVYPLDTIKTYLNKGSDEKGNELKSATDVLSRVIFRNGRNLESLLALFSGVESKIIMSMTQKFIYFYIYNYLLRKVIKQRGHVSWLMNLVIGYLSALSAVAILTPFEISQTIKQLDQSDKRSNLEILRKIVRNEGIPGLYKGLSTNVILCINPAIDYTVFEQVKKFQLDRKNAKFLTDGNAFWLGAFSKAVATVITFPHVRAKVLQQAGVARFGNMTSTGILVSLLLTDGPSSWFAGMKTQLMKNILASAIMMAAKERIERFVLKALQKETSIYSHYIIEKIFCIVKFTVAQATLS